MAIRRSDKSRFERGGRTAIASVSTLPTVKAMVDCFERYINLIIANGNASDDTIKTYRNRVAQFISWCKKRELYPALITKKNIIEYRKHLVDDSKTAPTIRLSLLAIRHFYTSCLAEKLVKDNPAMEVKAPREKREVGSTINYLSLEELQQLIDSILPTYKIRGEKTTQVQVLRDRILLGCMALQGCRSIEMYRANFGDFSSTYGQHYLKLDGSRGDKEFKRMKE
jgi:site-specific recombinase XerD